MGLWSSLFSRKEPEDYEQILSSLALDIHKRQTRLAEIRLRERRTTLLVTLYAIAAWGVYVAFWYAGFVPGGEGRRMQGLWKVAKGAPVIVGPIVIQFTRRIVQAWYTRIGNAEESTLKQLLAQQRAKIEEIKQKTNFYSTKNLIERYDSSGPGQNQNQNQNPGGQRQGRPSGVGVGPSGQVPVTPQRGQGQRDGPRQSLVGMGARTPVTPANGGPVPGELAFTPAQQHLASLSPGSSPFQPILPGFPPNVPPQQLQFQYPPRKQWYDKLADALLGDDEVSTGGGKGEMSKYALVCGKCFAHNGLVKEELWEDMQYVCPKCGYFNPSHRSIKNAQSRPSPLAPNSPSLSTPPSSPPIHSRLSSSSPPSSSPLSSPSKRVITISDEEDEEISGYDAAPSADKSGLGLVGADESKEKMDVDGVRDS